MTLNKGDMTGRIGSKNAQMIGGGHLAREPVERLGYRVQEVCRLLGVGRTWLYSQMSSGALRAKKTGSRTFITAPDLQAWINQLPAFKPTMVH